MKKIAKKFVDWFLYRSESGVVLVLILMAAITYATNDAFLSVTNIINFVRASGFTVIVIASTAVLIIIGGLDLSVGSVYAFSALVCGLGMTKLDLPIPVTILLGVLAGAAFGLINGVVIVKFGVPPMIATLGSQYIARGLVTAITKGIPVYPLPDTFKAIESTRLFGEIPIIILIGAVVVLIFHLLMSNTIFGRSVYAIGGNTEAAKISGISVDKTKIAVYILSGICAALAGILMSSRLGSCEPTTGVSLEMKAICGSVIGGVSITGGSGTIIGAALGALFMEMLTNSLTFMKVSIYYQNVVFGVILILSVLLDRFKRKIIKNRSVGAVKLKKE